MEHLMPPGEGQVPIVLPFFAFPEGSTIDDWCTFPQRHGFDFSAWTSSRADFREEISFKEGQYYKLPGFLLSWLYFGQLTTLLGHSVNLDDFVRVGVNGCKLLTTEKLPMYLERWDHALTSSTNSARIKAKERYIILANVTHIVRKNLVRHVQHCTPNPLRKRIQDSLLAIWLLQDSLKAAVRKIVVKNEWPGELYDDCENPMLKERMLNAMWCPYLVRMLQDSFDTELQAHLFAVGTSRSLNSHSGCSESVCTNSQAGSNFRARHCNDICDCNLISIPDSELVGILQQGHVPILTMKRDNITGRLHIHVAPNDASKKYIAISHLWADGLGNSAASQILTCQAENLFKALSMMHLVSADWTSGDFDDWEKRLEEYGHVTLPSRPESFRPIDENVSLPFWMDTLCIPVRQEHAALRTFSLENMGKIYKSATAVLVLDKDLRTLPANATPNRIFASLILSDWRLRLWTYQEGILARDIFVQGQDCVFSLRHEMSKFKKVMLESTAKHHQLIEKLYYRVLRLILNDSLRDASCNSNSSFSTALGQQRLIAAMSDRMTSQPQDETECITVSLGLSASPLRNLPADQRMACLLRMMPGIPLNLLFALGPRHTVPSLRWAPRTILAPHGVRNTIVIPETNSVHAAIDGELTARGLRVKLPAIDLGYYPADPPSYAKSTFYFTWNATLLEVKIIGLLEGITLEYLPPQCTLLLSAWRLYHKLPALMVCRDGGVESGAIVVRPLALVEIQTCLRGQDAADFIVGKRKEVANATVPTQWFCVT